MSDPTPDERTLGERLNIEPAAIAAARDGLNAIASLPWPRPERVSLLARIARTVRADVGTVLAGYALDAAPLVSFDALVPILGIGLKRTAGLARALSTFDPSTVSKEGARLREAWTAMTALRGENAELRAELDRLRVQLEQQGGAEAPALMRIGDVARSIGSQVTLVDEVLRSRANGLQLGAVNLHLSGGGATVDGEVALEIGAAAGGSALGLSFVPGTARAGGGNDVEVPDVGGYTTALAQRKLTVRGFTVAVASVAGARGVVSTQSPAPGERASSGSVVRLLVR